MVKISKVKLPLPHHPDGIERDYLRALLALLNENVFSIILSALEKDYKIDKKFDDEKPKVKPHLTIMEIIKNLFSHVNTKFEKATKIFETKIKKAGSQTSTYNQKVWAKQVKSALAVDIFAHEKWLEPALKDFTETNVKLIKKMQTEHVTKVSELVKEAVRNGDSFKTLAPKIEKAIGVTESRAALIARDQISKFNGLVSKLRQENLGITKYIWVTMRDERVRPKHQELDGQEFSWDNPPSEGHPGEPINCRCIPQPVFESMVG